MSIINIPPEYEEGIKKLIGLSDEQVENIIQFLQNQSPTLKIQNLAIDCANAIEYSSSSEDIENILEFVLALFSLKDEGIVNQQNMLEEVIKAIQDNQDLLKIYNNYFDNKEDLFKKRLKSFLQLEDTFKTSFKAISLITEQNNLFLNSRVVTDIRPIFNDDSKSLMLGAITFHNLKIEYRNDNEAKTFYVSLDLNDVIKLQEQLNEAITKDSVIKDTLKNFNVNYIDL